MARKGHEGLNDSDLDAAPSVFADPATAKVLQKRQLIARVAQRLGQRNSQVKETVEATLAELSEAISTGQTLALPPLGRARISRQKDVSGGEVIVMRIRRRKGGPSSDFEEND